MTIEIGGNLAIVIISGLLLHYLTRFLFFSLSDVLKIKEALEQAQKRFKR